MKRLVLHRTDCSEFVANHDPCDCDGERILAELVDAARWMNWEEAKNRPEGKRLDAALKPFLKEKK